MTSLLGILDRIGCDAVESIIVRTTPEGAIATLLCRNRAIEGVTSDQLQELCRRELLAPHIVGHLVNQGVITAPCEE